MMRTIRSVGLTMLILVLFASAGWAAEPVTINSLFAYPEAYKMKVVQVEGRVKNYRMNHFIATIPTWKSVFGYSRSRMTPGPSMPVMRPSAKWEPLCSKAVIRSQSKGTS